MWAILVKYQGDLSDITAPYVTFCLPLRLPEDNSVRKHKKIFVNLLNLYNLYKSQNSALFGSRSSFRKEYTQL